MVVAVELRGTYRRAIFAGPEDQVEALRVIEHDALLGFCFMSTHLHLMWEVEHLAAAERRTRLVARRLNSTADERGVALVDEPHMQILPDDHAIMRYLAYAHGNPVTAGMVNDPLSWALSSHRDVNGLRAAPWFSPARVFAHMDDQHDFAWLHRTAHGSMPLPARADPVRREWPVESFEILWRTVGAVYGLTDSQMRAPKRGASARHCLAALAHWLGWTQAEIAHAIGWDERRPQRISLEPSAQMVSALTMLTDPRLRPTGETWWIVPAEARGPALWKEWREQHGKIQPVGISPRKSAQIPR
jgi:hypothetical protein